jgi:hypothetical protein
VPDRPTLGIYASTGRTGSTFLARVLRRTPVVAWWHGRLFARLEHQIESPEEMLTAYVAKITEMAREQCVFPESDPRVYIEGNPRFIERVAQKYEVPDPQQVVRSLQVRGFCVRCLFVVRDPRRYAVSIKSRWPELGPDSWPPAEKFGTTVDAALFERMYGHSVEWLRAQDYFGRICASWLLRNRFLKKLVDLPECVVMRFEDIFGPDVSDREFVQRVQRIRDHFQLPGYARIDQLLVERQLPRRATSHPQELTKREIEQLQSMCGADAEEWGYTI